MANDTNHETELAPTEIASTGQEDEVTLAPPPPGQRIQFIQTTRPDRGRESSVSGNANLPRRHSIPRVVTDKEKKRNKKEEGKEDKHVDIDEHLMDAVEVAQRYGSVIDIEKPPASFGLSSADNDRLLEKYGRNVLTPPKKRHPILKYLDCLKNLFNLLLIVAGILEYILLGIDYKDNFQNVSVLSLIRFVTDSMKDLSRSNSHCCRFRQCLYRILPATKISEDIGVLPQHDSSKDHVYS
jgi:hypothetical protein